MLSSNSTCSLLIALCLFPIAIWCKQASTIITAPSTISPKSNAPKLIKLPLTPNKFIRITAINIAIGITEATIKPALILPKKNIKTNNTINAPSIKLVPTVFIELFTILVRSKNGSSTTPSGNVFLICSIRSLIFWITILLFAPFNIITTAPDTSPFPL